MEVFGIFIPNWLKIIVVIGVSVGVLIYAWKKDYLSWYTIKDMFSMDGVKSSLATIIEEPKFIFIYILFVFVPLWIFTDGLHLYNIPLYQKIILSIGGIFGVNYIMAMRGLK